MINNIVSIQYLERPVTDDEKKIAALLEKIVRAIAAKDVDLLVSVYSDTATIEVLSLRDAPISKSEYRERMSKFIGNVRNFSLRDAIIRVNGQEAIVSYINVILLRGKAFPEKNRRYLKCVNKGEKWLITEARYI